MANLNYVDYILLAIFVLSVLAGIGRGLVREIIALITLIAAVVVSIMFADTLAQSFTSSNASAAASYVAIGGSFALIFIGTLLIGSLIGYVVNMAFQFGMLGFTNRLLGSIFGAIRGLVFIVVLVFLVQLTSFSNQDTWQQSQVVAASKPAVVWLGNIVSPSLSGLKDKFNQTMQNVNPQATPNQNETPANPSQ